jgi:hypothetical protein
MDAVNSIDTPKTLQMNLVRYQFTPRSTIGKLSLNGVFQCYTLELVADGKNTSNKSAIPEGSYPVTERWSHHFGRNVLGLSNVKDRSDIEIHIGNTPSDVKGCILVGVNAGPDFVGNSNLAFSALMSKFSAPAVLTIESASAVTE